MNAEQLEEKLQTLQPSERAKKIVAELESVQKLHYYIALLELKKVEGIESITP